MHVVSTSAWQRNQAARGAKDSAQIIERVKCDPSRLKIVPPLLLLLVSLYLMTELVYT